MFVKPLKRRIKMKILKEGNLELFKQTKRFSCSYCGCEFEADKDEYNAINQYNEYSYFCKCPCCGKRAYEEI